MTEAELIKQLRDALRDAAITIAREFGDDDADVVRHRKTIAAASAYLARPRGEPVGTVQVMGSYQGAPSLGCLIDVGASVRVGDKLYAAPAAPEWVSVEERLPEEPVDGEDVPVYTFDGEHVIEDDYTEIFEQPAGPTVGGWVSIGWGFGRHNACRVTHWMPRKQPAPPSAKEKP